MRACKSMPIVLLLSSVTAWALPGDPDPTWSYAAPVVLAPDSTDVVPMPGGWMVVRARLPAVPATTSTVELTSIDDDGRPVASFGSAGTVVADLPGPFNVSLAAAGLDDGGFVLAGYRRLDDTGDTVAAVVKLNAQGQVDAAFGEGGVVEIDSPFALDRVGAIQQLQDGRIALLTWARVEDFSPYECSTDRTVLWYLSADGREKQEVHAVARDSYAGASCRSVLTLQADWDEQDRYRILFGSEIGIYEGSAALVPSNDRYGPFAFHWYYPYFYTHISGPGIALLGGPTPASTPRLYGTLGRVAGFGDEPISWNGMAIDHTARAVYLGFSTDNGRVAIARFLWTGTLDTGWGDGDGVVVIEGAGSTGDGVLAGIANDVRLLQVRSDGVVVATADGVIRRLQTGSADSSGAFVLRPPLETVRRSGAGQSFAVVVERAGSANGVATVQYAIKEAECGRGQCAQNWELARAGEDFVAASGTLRWEDGDSTDKTIRVELLGPSSQQPYELLVAELSSPSGGALIITDWTHIFLDQSAATAPTPPGSGSGNAGSSGGGAIGPMLFLLLLAAGTNRRSRRRCRAGRIGPGRS